MSKNVDYPISENGRCPKCDSAKVGPTGLKLAVGPSSSIKFPKGGPTIYLCDECQCRFKVKLKTQNKEGR